jgi:hypothetical protein
MRRAVVLASWLVVAPACETVRDVLVTRSDPDAGSLTVVDGAPVAPDAPPSGNAGDAGDSIIRVVARPGLKLGPISPGIYGVNLTNGPELNDARPGLVRYGNLCWGSTYNWENNAGNGGATWCFENGDAYGGGHPDMPGAGILSVAQAAGRVGAIAMLEIPLMEFVAADRKAGSGPPACSGDVRHEPNFQTVRFRRNLARRPGGPQATPELGDGSVYQDEMVAAVKRGTKTPVVFTLDRMPQMWYALMPHLHPGRVGYDELIDRELAFAGAAKDAWPSVPILASSVGGWSGIASLEGATDQAKGFFLTYFMDRLAAAEATRGSDLIDGIDVSWAPDVPGSDTNESVVERRLQAPRSLWDPTYVEDTTVGATVGGPIRLIPRLKEMIAAHRPGLGLAFSDWDYGGGGSVSGALAAADVLGIFGREGVRYAVRGVDGKEQAYLLAAFRAYRNYDGIGGRFGDVAVQTTTNDATAASAYASVESNDPTRLVLIVIHKGAAPAPLELTIEGDVQYHHAAVYRVTGDEAAVRPGDMVDAERPGNAFRLIAPARSLLVLVPRP